MEEVTFTDILTHYRNRITEFADALGNLRGKLRTAQTLAENSWHGAAGTSCQDKLLKLTSDAARCEGDLSEVMIRLDAVGAAYAESEAADSESSAD